MWQGFATSFGLIVVRRSGGKAGYEVRVSTQDAKVVYDARSGMIATVSN